MSSPHDTALYRREVERWLEAVRVQHERVAEARDEHWEVTSGPGPPTDRLLWHGDRECHFMLISARNLLRFALKLKGVVDEAELRSTVDRFRDRVARAWLYRDLFEHLDEYLAESPKRKHKELNWPFGAEVGYSAKDISYSLDGRHVVSMSELADACDSLGNDLEPWLR